MTERQPRRRENDVVVREFEEQNETAVLTLSNGQVVMLNQTLAAIWYFCDGARGAEDIAREIEDALPNSDAATVRADVVRALSDLRGWGLIE